MRARLDAAMAEAAEQVRSWPATGALVLHHNDADGITSGAIVQRALSRLGRSVRRLCLEKPYPQVLERVLADAGQLIVLADFAGRIAPLLSQLNRGRNLVIVLDHHKAQPATDSLVLNLDPDLYGFLGDRDVSASSTCLLFATALDAANNDLAGMATLGAVGDGFYVNGHLHSLNQEVARLAEGQGQVVITTDSKGAHYALASSEGHRSLTELARCLDTLGAVGYYEGGADQGVELCLSAFTRDVSRQLERLQALRDHAFATETKRLAQRGLGTTEHLQWLHVEDRFAPMGVKTIGVFLEHIKDSDLVDPHKYLAGFQHLPDQIPGLGAIIFNQVKISMRVPAPVAAGIRQGEMPGLDTFLPAATKLVGGFADACHSLTAATTVAAGQEETLIELMQRELDTTGKGA